MNTYLVAFSHGLDTRRRWVKADTPKQAEARARLAPSPVPLSWAATVQRVGVARSCPACGGDDHFGCRGAA